MKQNHHTLSPVEEHNPTASYVIGFILSIIFTLIPYSLVVNKTLSGNNLIAVILGFAIVQMMIQIFFFLHLGRGPKPFYNIVFFAGTVGLILVTVGGSIFIMNNLYANMSPEDAARYLAQKEGIAQLGDRHTGACQGTLDNHQVVFRDGSITPVLTTANRCDTLTIINQDEVDKKIAFGEHDQHTGYGGNDEFIVQNDRNKTIVLNETGSFLFHDHYAPEAMGYLTVEE